MNFLLSSLSDAFHKAEYQSAHQDFLLYCFILATPADNNIFPKLFAYLPELHWLTSRYILVISPRIQLDQKLMRDMKLHFLEDTGEYARLNITSIEDLYASLTTANSNLDSLIIAEILRSGRLYDHHLNRYVDFSDMIEEFLKCQTSETINFARFCGIGVNKIPCIVFFSSLKNPNQYIIWELENQDATSVIKDFRNIVAKVEEAYNEVPHLFKALEELNQRRKGIEWAMEKEKEETARRIKKLKSRKERLLNLQNAPKILGTRISKTQYQATPELEEIIESTYENLMSRFRAINKEQTNALPLGHLSKRLHQLVLRPYEVNIENYIRRYTIGSSNLEDLFCRYLDAVRQQKRIEIREPIYTDSIIKLGCTEIEYITNKIKSEYEKNLDDLKKETEKIDDQIAKIKLDLPEALNVIHSLDRKRYVLRFLSNLGRSVPILNLGLSTANIFK